MNRVIGLTLVIIIVFWGVVAYESFSTSLSSKELYSLFVQVATIIFSINIVLVIITLIRENRDPRTSIAWLQLLILLPVQGFILYLIFGINWRKRKMFAAKATLDANNLKKRLSGFLPTFESMQANKHSVIEKKIISLMLNNNAANLTQYNQVKTFFSAKQAIDETFETIKKAKHHIHIMFFRIANDEIGYKLQKLLIQKARQGVKVRLIYDDVGCFDMKKSYRKAMAENSIEIYPFYPVTLRFFANRVNYRNHRKIVIIDGKIAFTGGVNIGDKYMNKSPYFGFWRDTQIKIEGEAVYDLQQVFLQDWVFASQKTPDLHWLFPKHYIKNLLPMQTITSGPDAIWENIMQFYFTAINSATKFIWITTPYLVLDESLTMALKTASLSGVDVRIIIPSKPDHKIVFYGTRSYFEELLRAGIRLYEYEKGFIHAKTMLVDSKISSIGTANLDIRSFKLNFEVNTVIYDEHYGKDLYKQFEKDFENSTEVLWIVWQKRKRLQKFAESFARLLSPVL